MQVKKEGSKKKTEKRKVKQIVLGCILGFIWLGAVLFTGVLIWGVYLVTEMEIWRIIGVGILCIILFGIACAALFCDTVEIKTKRYRIYRITVVVTTITMLIVPLILQGVYRATKDNIVVTEDTQAVIEETIYFTDENEAQRKIQVATENDVIEVSFEANVQPYVEVVQYCTTVTTDNQNPWGRKYTETVKEWKQYEFHLPALETNN